MLTQCPECNLQISDKAIMCPHCGYPLKPEKISRSKKRKRLPNGFGQISEIKGRNLRKPFRAMVTVGKTQTGRPICKPLKPESYFETYNDAYTALVEYNRKPYELEKSITVKELFERWSPTYNYTYLIEKLVKKFNLDPNHRPHDGRKHFVTEAKKYNVDEYAIKYIVGHVINDLTESTYTERTFEWLKEEMQKIR